MNYEVSMRADYFRPTQPCPMQTFTTQIEPFSLHLSLSSNSVTANYKKSLMVNFTLWLDVLRRILSV